MPLPIVMPEALITVCPTKQSRLDVRRKEAVQGKPIIIDGGSGKKARIVIPGTFHRAIYDYA